MFRGHVTVHAPSMKNILALAAVRIPQPAPFAGLTISSDIAVSGGRNGTSALDLAALHLSLDGNDYEGALAVRGGAKPTIAGTLATEQLAVAPFIDGLPHLLDAARQWNRQPLTFAHFDPVALDLRISASHLRIAPLTIDDAALAVMTRGDRTEIVLAEGKAYGGDVKARASVGFAGDTLHLRGVGTLNNVDAATLSWDGTGRQIATGTVSGSASFDTDGSSPAELVSHLNGSIKTQATDGEIVLSELGRGTPALDDKRLEAMLPETGGRAPFHDLAVALRLTGGAAHVESAFLHGQYGSATGTGIIDLARRRFDLHMATTVLTRSGGPTAKPLRLKLGGSFDNRSVMAEPTQPDLPGIPPR